MLRAAVVGLGLLAAAPAGAEPWRTTGPGPEARLGAAVGTLLGAPLARAPARRIWRALAAHERDALVARLGRIAEAGASPWPWAALGTFQHAGGQARAASEALARALERLPGTTAAGPANALRRALALSELDGGRPAAACAALAGYAPEPATAHALALAERLLPATPGSDAAPCGLDFAQRLLRAGPPGRNRARLLELATRAASASGDHASAFATASERVRSGTLPDPERAAAWRELVGLALRAGRLAALEQELLAHLRSRPGDLAAARAAVRVSSLRGDPAGALGAALAGLERAPRDRALRAEATALASALGETEVLQRLRAAPSQPRAPAPGPSPHELAQAPRELREQLARHRGDPATLARLADEASAQGHDELALACWQAVLRVRPRDPDALTGLGELHYQRGRRELALATWQRLLPPGRADASAHVRLALLLSDHDLHDVASAQLERARALAPAHPTVVRALAIAAERRKDGDQALARWRELLDLARARGLAPERREARARVQALFAAGLSGPHDPWLAELRRRCERDDCDDEDVLLLVALERAVRRPQRAASVLEAAATRRPRSGALLRELLEHYRQSGQVGAATALLAPLAEQDGPERRWATLRLIELAREGGRRTLAAARVRAALAQLPGGLPVLAQLPGDLLPAALEVSDLLDDPPSPHEPLRAAARTALRSPAELSARARAEVARFLVVAADRAGLAELLALPPGPSTTELGQLARIVAEQEGELHALAHAVAVAAASAALEAAQPDLDELHRELLAWLIPPLHRRARLDADARAHEELALFAELGLRPLLESLRQPSRPAAAALIGMLGQPRAVPALAGHLRALLSSHARGPDPLALRAPHLAEQATRALVALGRIGDPRALTVVLEAAPRLGPGGKLAALWALGRLGDHGAALPPAARALLDETLAQARQPELAAMAALSLGRLPGYAGARPRLLSLLADPERSPLVRRAAALGLALGVPPPAPDGAAVRALAAALGSENAELRRAAARALARQGELPALFDAVLRAPAEHAAEMIPALLHAGRPLLDDAAVIGDPPAVEPLLRALAGDATDAVPAELARETGDALARLLEHAPALRARLALVLRDPAARPHALRALAALVAECDAARAGAGGELLREWLAEPLRAVLPELPPGERLAAIELLLRAGPGLVDLDLATPVLALADAPEDSGSLAELSERVLAVVSHPALGGAAPERLAERLSTRCPELGARGRLLCVRLAARLGAEGRALLHGAAGRDPDPVVRAAARAH